VVLAVSSILATAVASEARGMDLLEPGRPETARAFTVVNDGVMGGVSTSRVAVEGGALVFAGTVRLERGGGFASVRARVEIPDLAGFDGVELVVRGDGRRYKLDLRDDGRLDGIAHRVAFETRAEETQTLRFPFEAFQPSFRGRGVADAPPLDPTRIEQLGLLISDRQAGDFRLEVLAIRAYRSGES
jgi:hypothetical protein